MIIVIFVVNSWRHVPFLPEIKQLHIAWTPDATLQEPAMSANSKSQFMHGTEIPQNENNVLRKTAVYIERASARAISRPYGPPPGSNKLSSGLEVGTQQKMIDAAYEAYRMKGPLNTYLSIRWRGLFAYDNTHFLTSFGGTERIRYIIELGF